MTRGGCLCGGVRFALTGAMRPVVACHCTQCRKTSGHYWAATQVDAEHFSLTRDETLRWFASSETAERGFCTACGASLFWRKHGEGRISIAAGALEGETGLHIIKHIYGDDRGDYYPLPGEGDA